MERTREKGGQRERWRGRSLQVRGGTTSDGCSMQMWKGGGGGEARLGFPLSGAVDGSSYTQQLVVELQLHRAVKEAKRDKEDAKESCVYVDQLRYFELTQRERERD